MIILEHDGLLCQRCSFTGARGSTQPHRFRLSEWETVFHRPLESTTLFPSQPSPPVSCQRLPNNTRGIPMSNHPRSRRMGRKQMEGAHKTVRFAERRKFADYLDGYGLSTLGRGFIRCSVLCPLSISTASEFVRITSRSVRTEVRRCASKGGSLTTYLENSSLFFIDTE